MVRYSKLPFRLLCLEGGTDIVYTPMILADCFAKSVLARDTDLQTHSSETGRLVVQFAASDPVHFGTCARMVQGHCIAVNLNCGCPQRWAQEEGIGSALLDKPHLIADCIRQMRNQTAGSSDADSRLQVSIKIRLLEADKTASQQLYCIRRSVDLARQIEAAGADWVDVHGRTRSMRSGNSSVQWEAVAAIKQALHVPVVHNGDVMSLDDAVRFHELTGVDGIMAARGLLKNPSLFAGDDRCSPHILHRFLDLATSFGSEVLPLSLVRNHMCFMLHDMVSRNDLVEFMNAATSVSAMVDWMQERGLQQQQQQQQDLQHATSG